MQKPSFQKWPVWDSEEVSAVKGVIESGSWWCGAPEDRAGEQVWSFQREFASLQESKHCIAVANGTVALEAVLLALDIGLGDEVILSDFTFFASASAVAAVNAVPIFCDIDPDTLLLDVKKTASLITPRTRAIIAVHLGGNPTDMDAVCELASEHDLKVIEDCAHAQGSRYRGTRVGNLGDAGTFSFQASKTLTAGEGGAIVCNDGKLADNIYSVTDCGRRRGGYFYSHYRYGGNYRMPELSAALLRVQLKRFPSQHRLRNASARYLSERLNAIPGISVMKPTPGADEIGYYVYPFLFDPEFFNGMDKKQFVKKLHAGGIETDDPYPPLHSLHCFRNCKLRKGIDYTEANWGDVSEVKHRFPVVSDVFQRTVQLPHYLLLSERKQLDYIVEFIENLK
jgi:dTDP-4-amino-4,6-dideoxygalactose transaminase